eukprot:m.51552 g.51552  ORF g.51552 m.51552 type:complete len:557 (-) comp10739_c0_seq2:92-1762(-)
MEFEEILSYKPKLDLDAIQTKDAAQREAEESRQAKRKRENDEPQFAVPRRPALNKDEVLKKIEEDNDDGETFNKASLKRLVAQLDKNNKKNQELRMKFADTPTKFLDSEVELHATLQEFNVVATTPHLYSVLVKTSAVKTLLGLISHENVDITGAVVEVLQELTDADALENDVESAGLLINKLFQLQFMPIILDALTRLTDPDDANIVHACLGILENVLEMEPKRAEEMVSSSEILSWLLKRLKGKKFDKIKLYVSEILSILVQDSDVLREKLGKLDGIDRLLGVLAVYKKRDPGETEEHEMMENIFDILCSSLLLKSNGELFIKAEGLELMIIMMREKKISLHGAIKVLNHALSKKVNAEMYTVFIDRFGLKSLFPLFMITPGGKRKKMFSTAEFEEHVCSIIASLFKFLEDGVHKQRLLRKFIENDFEKMERLVELHLAYIKKVEICDKEIAKEKEEMVARGEELDEIVENSFYLRRLDAGLSVLQHVAYTIGTVSLLLGDQVTERVEQLLKLKGGDIESVRDVLLHFQDEAGEEDDDNGAVSKQTYERLIDAI